MKGSLKFYSKISQKRMNRIPTDRYELTEGNRMLLLSYSGKPGQVPGNYVGTGYVNSYLKK